MRTGRTLMPLLVVLVAASCARVADGAVRPARGLTPRPLTGQAVKQVLLDDSELSKIVNQPFKGRAELPPRFGGRELLFPLPASPRECGEVEFELHENSYGQSDIRGVAQETWFTATLKHVKVISVEESVVALSSAGAADALFATLTQQWKGCNGTTVTSDFPSGPGPTAVITDVRAADSVLAATVEAGNSFPITSARAVGVRVNCLVEVNVAFFADHRPDGTAVNIAHAMMDKVSSLS
jgi:PknH-like extracellular domain